MCSQVYSCYRISGGFPAISGRYRVRFGVILLVCTWGHQQQQQQYKITTHSWRPEAKRGFLQGCAGGHLILSIVADLLHIHDSLSRLLHDLLEVSRFSITPDQNSSIAKPIRFGLTDAMLDSISRLGVFLM